MSPFDQRILQVTRTGVDVFASPEIRQALRERFDREHYLILPRMFSAEMLEMLLDRVGAAVFEARNDNNIAREACMSDALTESLILFLLNNPQLHRVLGEITGIDGIGNFSGRVYRMNSTEGHYDSWHNDVKGDRVLTLSANLSTREFQGGGLQLRRAGASEILHEVRNTGLGDGLVFRISRELEHRVLPVEGDAPKTALAGWFRPAESLHNLIRHANETQSSGDDGGELPSVPPSRSAASS
ncbi:MAG: 2OG-Fe(II) oxygenase [Candidatus Acidiferrales bacterium]